MIGVETVTLITPGTPGKHGEPGGPPKRKDYDGCTVYPRYSTEDDGRASTVIVGMTLLAPLGTPVKATSSIEWRGDLYTVDGRPGPWRFSDGSDAGLEVALKYGED